MSIRTTQGSALAPRHTAEAAKSNQGAVYTWSRPEWRTLPTVLSTDQKFVGLHAVYPEDGNFCAFTASGAYTVDWGDGVVENFAAATQANHLYDYSDADLDGTNAPVTFTASTSTVNRTAHGFENGRSVSFWSIVSTTGIVQAQAYYVVNATADTFQVSATVGGSPITLTNDGSAALTQYKQAIVTVTPQVGQNLTALNLNIKHSQATLQTYNSGWLDISVSSPNFGSTGLTISASTQNVRQSSLERATLLNIGSQTSLNLMFYNCYALQSVPLFNTLAVTDMNLMFSGCYALQSVPLFNTAAVTNMNNMFSNCYALQSVPLFNTAAVTNMGSMFSNCSALQSVPLFNTAAVTNMNNMFSNCYALQSVLLFNTAAVTDMTSMFSGCFALQSVPLFNTAAVTNMSSMLSGCRLLQSVPLFNTLAVTNMSSMFSSCYALQSVPLFNTAAVTNMNNMFSNCYVLQSVPLFNTAAVTNMGNMFTACRLLQSVPLFNTAAVTNMSSMLSGCYALQSVPALVTTAVISGTNFSSMFSSCNSLSRIEAKNFRFTFSVTNCKLSATALNEIYTNLPTVTGQTITVTGNYGAATDNPTIATAKGWTVTG